ncbi:kinase-like domain-containing protein [Lentinula raphanica]|uniref:Kinase-like domain-containing protein n=1 Tax=Lentinula raphanica TaxID=153919 RepID=A0AA38P8Q0_9AGAR|nr:kinase-like domain-containing protein [Lentinula raphanica]KAJ3973952.1 kinase-like domain-containing protein [Lentinula raphanica]
MSGSTRTSASSSISPKTDTQTEDDADESGLVYYLDSPLPTQTTFDHVRPQIQKVESAQQPLRSGTFGVKPGERDPYGLDEVEDGSTLDIKSGQKTTSPISARGHGDSKPLSPPLSSAPVRPSILISNDTVTARDGPFTAPASGSSPFSTIVPVTPNQRYGGWLSEVVKPLEEFIDEAINPRDYYLDLTEVAQGGNGSVYAARVSDNANIARLSKLPPLIKAQDVEGQTNGEAMFVAIKSVPLSPSGSTKLDELRRELVLLRGLMHGNILAMHALYVDLVDDSLWIRMELMERSLADVVVLCEEGLVLQERVIARFTHDTLAALKFLRSHNIAHRDVRSDNLLLNSQGILKLTDFSNAIKVSQDSPIVDDAVGILYWQAPEIRAGPYNALQVDIWSVGATVWELAQAAPPFSDTDVPGDRWPRLRKPEIFSPSFHEFLRLCSEPAVSRPDASDLLKNAFVNNTCGRPVIGQLLQQCVAIERVVSQRQEMEDGEDEATLMIS